MSLRLPPLADVHEARGARLTEFGGWEMPVEFDSIREEHAAVREGAGIFDVSHMGEIEVTGPDAGQLTDRLVTNDVAGLVVGDSCYGMITDENGIILDDTIVYRRGPERYLFIPNAGHDAQMTARWTDHRDEWDLDATVRNATEEYAMYAVQGPDAPALVAAASDDGVASLSKGQAMETTVAGADCYLARTGYTGEDGFEILAPWAAAEAVWSAFDCQPCGLGARDTLRLEMGFLLSGQDFDPADNPRTPYEAGVGWTVELETEFVGREALAAQAERGVEERITGFLLEERGVPRHGYGVESPEGDEIGTVTSGTMSPSLGEPIGLAYLPRAYTDAGTAIAVVIRGESKKAKTHAPPFLPDK